MISPTSGYRADIDGLRALAILLVLGFHAFPDSVLGGYVGVDVFFVISGYLITRIILDARARGEFSYTDFYVRRIRRIFPALLVVLVPSFVFGWYVLLPHEFVQLERHIMAAATFSSNFSLWSEAGYFDNSANSKPLQHLWSLAIEEQFYIFWPVVLGLTWRHARKRLGVTAAIALVSFAINVWLVRVDSTAAFYLPVTRAWELLLGGWLAQQAPQHGERVGWRLHLQSIVGVVLILAAVVLLDSNRAFPGWWALLPATGAFLIIGAGPGAWINARLLGRREAVWIGLISYPLYLWHWPVLVFTRIVLQRNLVVVDRLAALSASFVLAFATYRLLERPIRRLDPVGSARAMAGMLATVLIVAIGAVHWQAQPRNDNDAISRLLAANYDWDYPDGLEHRIVAGALRRAYAYDSNRPTRTLFFGDSNMEQYFPRIRSYIDSNPATSNSAVMVGNQRQRCLSIVQIFLKEEDGCWSVMRDITALALDKETDAVAIIYGGLSWEFLMRTEAGDSNLRNFIKRMKDNGKRVYVVLSMPMGRELDPQNMFSGSRLSRLEAKPVSEIRFDYSNFLALFGSSRDKVARAARESGAVLIDPLQFLCVAHVCPVFDDHGAPLYKDWLHMRASYARDRAIYIDQTLAPTEQRR